MITYLFDASAAVQLYAAGSERSHKVVQYIAEQRKLHRKAVILIPNFCIAEVFNALAKKYFKEKKLDREAYENSLKRFREDIHWGKILYPYDLNRYHIIAADEIIPIEHNVASYKEWDHLSTFDILLIAMASELTFTGDPDNVYLVTCDQRIKKVCDQFRSMSDRDREALRVRRPGPPGLDEPEFRRWFPPKVIYLPTAGRQDIPSVPKQHPLNL